MKKIRDTYKKFDSFQKSLFLSFLFHFLILGSYFLSGFVFDQTFVPPQSTAVQLISMSDIPVQKPEPKKVDPVPPPKQEEEPPPPPPKEDPAKELPKKEEPEPPKNDAPKVNLEDKKKKEEEKKKKEQEKKKKAEADKKKKEKALAEKQKKEKDLAEKKKKEADKKKIKNQQEQALRKLEQNNAIDKLMKEQPKPSIISGNRIDPNSMSPMNKIRFMQYYESLKGDLLNTWTLPGWLAEKDLKAQVLVVLDSRGNVIRKEILTSSGNKGFDDTILTAVDKASPFPAPPGRLGEEIKNKELVFGFPEN